MPQPPQRPPHPGFPPRQDPAGAQAASPHLRPVQRIASWWAGAALLLAAGCQVAPMGEGLLDPNARPAAPAPAPAVVAAAPAVAAPAPAPVTLGLLDLLDRPAERALLAGLRAYDDGQYAESENQLKRALDGGLRSARDRAAAHKQLAFIYCTTTRMAQCELEFRAALRDDPGFQLTRGEAGHPMWGPVYRRVKAQ
jgi:hypothetical protein